MGEGHPSGLQQPQYKSQHHRVAPRFLHPVAPFLSQVNSILLSKDSALLLDPEPIRLFHLTELPQSWVQRPTSKMLQVFKKTFLKIRLLAQISSCRIGLLAGSSILFTLSNFTSPLGIATRLELSEAFEVGPASPR